MSAVCIIDAPVFVCFSQSVFAQNALRVIVHSINTVSWENLEWVSVNRSTGKFLVDKSTHIMNC